MIDDTVHIAPERNYADRDLRMACDMGGTFTDLAVVDAEGNLTTFKAPTTPADQGFTGLIDAVSEAAKSLTDGSLEALLNRVELFIYSTTRGLNALLEGKGARTALILTEGHRDILYFREGGKLDGLNLRVPYPRPLVGRSSTFTVPERVDAEGAIRVPLDIGAAREVLQRVREEEFETVAVCLLWSIVNPEHEQRLGALIEAELPGVPYTLSHAVNPIVREYRRASSTAIDAMLKPVMSDHLYRVQRHLEDAGFRGRTLCLTSAGGTLELEDVASKPIYSLNSGPSAAPVAARHLVASADDADGADTTIVMDAGGTSFDVTLLRGQEIELSREYWIGRRFHGYMLGLPAVNVKTVGAGGGSIASVDEEGLLHVGPESAGARPGPACYAAGNDRPTVTDAAVALGLIDPGYFLGGRMKLDRALAERALERHVAIPLGLDTTEAANAVLRVSDQNMVNSIEEITIDHGIDPREALLVAGGGAGGLSVDAIARELGCRRALIPRTASALSACGGVRSALTQDFSETRLLAAGDRDLTAINEVLARLRTRAEHFLGSLELGVRERTVDYYVGARYTYQVWELEVPLRTGSFDSEADLAALIEDFHSLHRRVFSVADEKQEVEFVFWRARATGSVTAAAPGTAGAASPSRSSQRKVNFGSEGWQMALVRGGAALEPGDSLAGPAIVEEPAMSILVRPGSSLSVLPSGDFVLEPDRGGRPGSARADSAESPTESAVV